MSFDGIAQDIQRKIGSSKKIISHINELLKRRNIYFEINSVFNPEGVHLLSDSIQSIIDLGVPNIRLSLSTIKPWNEDSIENLNQELIKLRKTLLHFYNIHNQIPVINFRKDKNEGIFRCYAGQDRLTITPTEEIVGCHIFHEYLRGKEKTPEYKKYSFGNLDYFMKNFPKIYKEISSNYSQFSMENYSTPKRHCFLCPDLKYCGICPANAALAGSPIGKIPWHMCQIKKIRIKQIKLFWKELGLLE